MHAAVIFMITVWLFFKAPNVLVIHHDTMYSIIMPPDSDEQFPSLTENSAHYGNKGGRAESNAKTGRIL
jgi:hypothetical protein